MRIFIIFRELIKLARKEKMVWIWTFFLAIIFINLLLNLLGPKNRKKLPPGPIGLPFLGHFHLLGKNPHRDLQRLARKHGPIMGLRFGPVPAVVVSSPAAAELVLKTHDLVFASRPPNKVARVISYDRDMVFGPYGPHWRDMRKFYTSELLNSSTMKQLEGMRRTEVGLLVRSLKEAGERREAVDLSGRISTVSQDMNFLMILGRKYSDGDVSDEGSNFKALLMEGMEIGAKFNLADYFPYADALDLHGINRKINRLSDIFDRFLEKIIDDHVGKEEREGFVGTMMAIMESGVAGFDLDRRQIKATLLVS